jgi:hypothetical protein
MDNPPGLGVLDDFVIPIAAPVDHALQLVPPSCGAMEVRPDDKLKARLSLAAALDFAGEFAL